MVPLLVVLEAFVVVFVTMVDSLVGPLVVTFIDSVVVVRVRVAFFEVPVDIADLLTLVVAVVAALAPVVVPLVKDLVVVDLLAVDLGSLFVLLPSG